MIMSALRLSTRRGLSAHAARRLWCSRTFSATPSTRDEPFRYRLSKIWTPTSGTDAVPKEGETGHDRLLKAGFIRQAHSGIFHFLPMGLRVQRKIEALAEKHMESIGAARVALSTFSSEALWRKTERLDKVGGELFRLHDRKDSPLLLSPTHEEEITTLVGDLIKTRHELPLRLFQITRKYRDEMRPRRGLLRCREFLMKDLYTFDTNKAKAQETYDQVGQAYRAFFKEMKLPVVVSEASSGDMGGASSHEYHLVSDVGADAVARCSSCGYTSNEEVVVGKHAPLAEKESTQLNVWRGISEDRKTLVNVWYPGPEDSDNKLVDLQAVKAVVPDLETRISNFLPSWTAALEKAAAEEEGGYSLINVVDSRSIEAFDAEKSNLPIRPQELQDTTAWLSSRIINLDERGNGLNLLKLRDGDLCVRCNDGKLHFTNALELGHTFQLGTRYSAPLNAAVVLQNHKLLQESTPMEMGCYGIGIDRIMASVAETMHDASGLLWPRAIAPFEVIVMPTGKQASPEMLAFYDEMARGKMEVVLDDRPDHKFGWKIRDADIVGYPVIVILGNAFNGGRGVAEVQCRALGVKEVMNVRDVRRRVEQLLARL